MLEDFEGIAKESYQKATHQAIQSAINQYSANYDRAIARQMKKAAEAAEEAKETRGSRKDSKS